MIGDGVTMPIHCENTEAPADREPDAGPIYCEAMLRKRWFELMNNPALGLTKSEIEQGWHFCPEWDGLLVGERMREIDCCTCEKT